MAKFWGGIGFAGFLFIVACSGGAPDAAQKERFAGGLSSCAEFRRTAADAAKGILTDAELREKLKKVQSRGSTAEPDIRDASTRVLSSVTQGDGPGASQAMADMFAACDKAGY